MSPTPLLITPPLHAYLVAHGSEPDEIATELLAETSSSTGWCSETTGSTR